MGKLLTKPGFLLVLPFSCTMGGRSTAPFVTTVAFGRWFFCALARPPPSLVRGIQLALGVQHQPTAAVSLWVFLCPFSGCTRLGRSHPITCIWANMSPVSGISQGAVTWITTLLLTS